MYDIRSFFNQRAEVWDRMSAHDPEKTCVMLTLCDIPPGSRILDVGCGTGQLEPFLLLSEPEQILAIDFAENMIREAQQGFQHPKVEFRCADYFGLRGEFDQAFFMSSFPHFADPGKAVEQAVSLLRPGGRIVIFHPQGKGADSADLLTPLLPAQGLINLLRPWFRLDIIIDTPLMTLISGIRLTEHAAEF